MEFVFRRARTLGRPGQDKKRQLGHSTGMHGGARKLARLAKAVEHSAGLHGARSLDAQQCYECSVGLPGWYSMLGLIGQTLDMKTARLACVKCTKEANIVEPSLRFLEAEAAREVQAPKAGWTGKVVSGARICKTC